jgi:hypothetical protein
MSDDSKKTTYLCKECKAMFWSYQEVVIHKGMTGHGEFIERKRSQNDAQSEA